MKSADDPRLAGVATAAVELFGYVLALPGEWGGKPAPPESAAVGRAAADCLHAWATDQTTALAEADAVLAG